MKKINKYLLDFNDAIKYFRDNLDSTNTLSSLLVKMVDFKSGHFFTLLPEDSNLENLNVFTSGGMLFSRGQQWSELILNKLKSNSKLLSIFDDFNSSFHPDYQDSLFLHCGRIYQNEVYYLITSDIATDVLIGECLCASNTIWHSLCVLSKTNIHSNKVLMHEDIENISINVQFIMIVAYDDEGYIFWEKNQSP